MREYQLPRTNQADLVFVGQRIALADTFYSRRRQASWLELGLYRTTEETYVMHATLHVPDTAAGSTLSKALVFTSARDLVGYFRTQTHDFGGLKGRVLQSAAGQDSGINQILQTSGAVLSGEEMDYWKAVLRSG